jgi:hypothetical protein
VSRQGLDDGSPLEPAEVLLAVVDEDLRDRLAGGRRDVVVGVAHGAAPALGEQAGHRRLAGTHRPDQHHARTARGRHANLRVDR